MRDANMAVGTAAFVLIMVAFMAVGVFAPDLWLKIVSIVVMAVALFGYVVLMTSPLRKMRAGQADSQTTDPDAN